MIQLNKSNQRQLIIQVLLFSSCLTFFSCFINTEEKSKEVISSKQFFSYSDSMIVCQISSFIQELEGSGPDAVVDTYDHIIDYYMVNIYTSQYFHINEFSNIDAPNFYMPYFYFWNETEKSTTRNLVNTVDIDTFSFFDNKLRSISSNHNILVASDANQETQTVYFVNENKHMKFPDGTLSHIIFTNQEAGYFLNKTLYGVQKIEFETGDTLWNKDLLQSSTFNMGNQGLGIIYDTYPNYKIFTDSSITIPTDIKDRILALKKEGSIISEYDSRFSRLIVSDGGPKVIDLISNSIIPINFDNINKEINNR